MKKIRTILLIFFVWLVPITSFAQSVDLICEIDLKTDNGGKISSQKIKTRIEVTEIKGGNIFIIPDSSLLNSVSTKTLKDRVVTNLSDDRKWHVTNTLSNSSGAFIESQFIIDRYLGTISYNHAAHLTTQSILSNGFGSCEKAVSQKKKF